MIIRLNLYHSIGALLLFIAVIAIYSFKESNIPLNTAGNLNLNGKAEYFVWFAIFFAFISRMPIWPFHYWLTAINSSIRNPLVFVVGNLISLVGLYGFMRFWPNTVPHSIAIYAPIFEIISAATMIFIALIGLSQKDFRYKLFSYTTVYYLLYLIGVFLPTGGLKMNIGYSLFAYLIIITMLSFLISHIEQQKKQLSIQGGGILCYLPRTSVCLSLFILAGIGLPITPLFWNNFIIISEIFNHNLILGVSVMLALFFAALSFLEELYRLKDKSFGTDSCVIGKDLSDFEIAVYSGCLIILFFSFFRPLWFVF
jgi:NADH-quinone oxidoreductase subunit M